VQQGVNSRSNLAPKDLLSFFPGNRRTGGVGRGDEREERQVGLNNEAQRKRRARRERKGGEESSR